MSEINWTSNDFNNGKSSSGTNTGNIAGTDNSLRQAYEHGSLTKGLVAYYPMERGKGEVIRDAALNNIGQIEEAEWAEESAVGDYSLEFDGDNDYVSTTFSGDFFAEGKLSSTVSLWVKSGDSDGDSFVLAGTKEGEREMNSMQISWGDDYDGTIGRPTFILDDDNNDDNVVEIEQDIDDNEWHHVVFVVNGSDAGDIRGYIDGSLADIHIERDDLDEDELVPTNVGMKIGARDDGDGGVSRHFEGQIEEVRIYNRPISRPEIEALYNLTRPNGVESIEEDVPSQSDGGVSRWGFDDDLDTDTAIDSWGGNDGSIEGAVYTSQRVYGSNSMSFDGGDEDEVVIDNPDPEPPTGNSPRSCFGWIYFLETDHNGNMITWGDDDTENARWSILLRSDDGVGVINQSNDVKWYGDLKNFTWHHVGATYDGNRVAIYIDGELIAREKPPDGDIDTATNEPITIGGRHRSGENFNGVIDNLRIYNRALSPLEVEKLFKKGAYWINRGDTLQ